MKNDINKLPKLKITAFHGIFEDKLKRLISKIKKLRKDSTSTSKQQVKNLIIEAKALKRLVRQDVPDDINKHTIQVALRVVDGKIGIDESCPSNQIKMTDIRFVGGLLLIEFNMKPLG